MGSSSAQIGVAGFFGQLVAGEIGSIVLVSAAVSLPLAALTIARYLAPFTERTPGAFWTLALATVAAFTIASVASAFFDAN